TGATAVKFNGTSAFTFSVDNDGQITAAFPAGATTGPITVVSPSGTATSTGNYTIGSQFFASPNGAGAANGTGTVTGTAGNLTLSTDNSFQVTTFLNDAAKCVPG